MSYFGVSLRNGVGLGLGTVPSLTNTPLSYRLAPSLDLSFAGSDALSPAITFSRTTNATLTNSAGLVANAPMNLLTYSEQFDNSVWTKNTGVTVTANTGTAPDGTTTADTVSWASTAVGDGIFQGRTLTVATHTRSVWVRAGIGGGVIKLSSPYYGGATDVTLSTTWTRVTNTGNASAGVDGLYIQKTATSPASFEVWGAQLELGSTATTYNPTTVKNLLGFTENFDNAAWTKSNASISATKVDDIYGQPFAQKLVEDTANFAHAVTQSASKGATVGTYAFSAYVKDGGRSKVRLLVRGAAGGGSGAYVDSSLDGSVIGTAPTIFGSGWTAGNFASQDMGNGWYRVSLTATTSTETLVVCTVQLLDSSFAPTYTGDGTSGIYIFGAQLSDSASVDPYVYQPVAAPSSVAYYGPRFDYDPVTLAPKGLLIEEQRVNYCLYSEDFTQASWTKSNTTVTGNSAVSPSGAVTADTITASSANGTIRQAIVTTAVPFTFSIYLKRKTGTGNVDISMDGTTWVTQTIDAVNWTRCIVTQTGVAGTSNPGIRLVTSGDEVYAWGAQAE